MLMVLLLLLPQQRLRKWTEAKIEFKRVKDEYDKKIDELRDRFQEKQNESAARHEGMIHYFWSVGGLLQHLCGLSVPFDVVDCFSTGGYHFSHLKAFQPICRECDFIGKSL